MGELLYSLKMLSDDIGGFGPMEASGLLSQQIPKGFTSQSQRISSGPEGRKEGRKQGRKEGRKVINDPHFPQQPTMQSTDTQKTQPKKETR